MYMFAIKSCVQKVRACTRRTAGVLGKLFAEFHCGSLRGVTFSTWRKSPKTRTGRGCFDSPSPCEPSPATTEVGLRSPFWNPLRVVQCLPLPMDFLAKINLAQKRRWFVDSLPSLGGNQRGTAHGSSLAVQGWGFKRGGEIAIPDPFVILCILSVHTESMPAERPAVGHRERAISKTPQCPSTARLPYLPHQNHKTCFRAKQKQVCCFHFTGFISSIFSIVNTVRKRE